MCIYHYYNDLSIISDTFSPIIMHGALVFPLTRCGMIDASATLRPFVPYTYKFLSTTDILSFPILHVLVV